MHDLDTMTKWKKIAIAVGICLLLLPGAAIAYNTLTAPAVDLAYIEREDQDRDQGSSPAAMPKASWKSNALSSAATATCGAWSTSRTRPPRTPWP